MACVPGKTLGVPMSNITTACEVWPSTGSDAVPQMELHHMKQGVLCRDSHTNAVIQAGVDVTETATSLVQAQNLTSAGLLQLRSSPEESLLVDVPGSTTAVPIGSHSVV